MVEGEARAADSKGETSAAGEDVRSTERRATGKTGETDEDEKME
jgi:hypothetical protein